MLTESSFYSRDELSKLGLGSFGCEVRISRRASFYNSHKIHLGSHVRIDDYCLLSANEEIRFGNHTHMGAYAALFGAAGVTLEDFTGLSSRVTIYTVSDDYSGETLTNPTIPEQFRTRLERGPVILRRHAIVGANSVVMPGVTVGEGAAIGAMSFVRRDCEPWTIYFGSPARRIRDRSRKLLESEATLLKSPEEYETPEGR